jgi:hypothetical protein
MLNAPEEKEYLLSQSCPFKIPIEIFCPFKIKIEMVLQMN